MPTVQIFQSNGLLEEGSPSFLPPSYWSYFLQRDSSEKPTKQDSGKLVTTLGIFLKISACQKFFPIIIAYEITSEENTMYLIRMSTKAKMTARQMQCWELTSQAILPQKPIEAKSTKTATLGKCLMKSTVRLTSISATSCQWLLTPQQCGSFVGKRLFAEILFTTFNEGAVPTATNQRSSQFLYVTQRLQQTTRTADQVHDTKKVTDRATHY